MAKKFPIVAIIGRPNVGKSTFFNRVLRKSEAIIHDMPGVTRDRNYGLAEWQGKYFTLIDTGGFVPESEDIFESAIREQAQTAIEEADAIIFITDSRDGIHPLDKMVADIIRKTEKPVLVAVNKIDSENYELNINDFYSLGFSKIFSISALSGRKIGDFLDELIKCLKFPSDIFDLEEDKRLKLAIVGRPNVGKSSYVNALLGYNRSIVTDIPGTTRDSVDSILKYYGEEIVLIDTAGLRKRKKIYENVEFYSAIRTLRAIAECDVAIVLIDATFGLDKQDLKIVNEAIERRKSVIIAVNKWDLVEKDSNTAKRYEDAIKQRLGVYDFIPVITISALEKTRIYKLIDLAKEVFNERRKKIPTSELNEILLAEIAKIPPPSTPTGKEIKIKYITQAEGSYPVFLLFANEHKYLPESYKRFIQNIIRKNFGFIGTPIILSFKSK